MNFSSFTTEQERIIYNIMYDLLSGKTVAPIQERTTLSFGRSCRTRVLDLWRDTGGGGGRESYLTSDCGMNELGGTDLNLPSTSTPLS